MTRSEPHLLFVGTSQSLAQRLFPNDDVPDWFPPDSGAENAALTLERWDEDKAMVHFSLWVRGDQHVVRVRVSALYGDVALDEYTDDDREDFVQKRTRELMPFVQQAVHTASGQVWPVKPILLDARTGRTVVGDPVRLS